MGNYRPICDVWLLARPKVAYYGSYPAGFLGRARDLLSIGPDGLLLHACSGKVRDYPFRRSLGKRDFTLDLDPNLKPDFCQDVRDPWPTPDQIPDESQRPEWDAGRGGLWDAILSDPPYSEADATHYAVGSAVFPQPAAILKRAFEVLRPGGRVGILHTVFPRPPKDATLVACIGVHMGFGNVSRTYSVFEKPWGPI